MEGAVGSGGPGQASRSTTPSDSKACGDLAGGRARRRPQQQRHHEQHTRVGHRPPAHTAARPGFEPTRRAKLVARTARGRAATHRHTQRPGPTAPGTPARQQAPQATTQRKRAAARQGLRAFTQLVRTRHRRAASHSAQSSGQPLSAVERPRPRRPGRRSGQRPCAGCRQRQPG